MMMMMMMMMTKKLKPFELDDMRETDGLAAILINEDGRTACLTGAADLIIDDIAIPRSIPLRLKNKVKIQGRQSHNGTLRITPPAITLVSCRAGKAFPLMRSASA
jgi:hypothetical protein